MGGEKFSWGYHCFPATMSMFRSARAIHSSWTWSPQAHISVMGGEKFSWGYQRFPATMSVFRYARAIHSSWTVPMPHYEYNEW
eukprot:scaffold37213_cov43-Cyclotella_meneghiniana.AAC.7